MENLQTGLCNYPIIPSSTKESMKVHWNTQTLGVSYKDKIILDLGAANGDSAGYFIFEGAKCVIAVDGDVKLFGQLKENSKAFEGKIIPILLQIEKPEDIEKLIVEFKPDIVKSDIEGAEVHLYNIKDEIWKMVPEYLVESHEGYGFVKDEVMRQKCKRINYNFKYFVTTAGIIYAVRENNKI